MNKVTLLKGDCLEKLKELEDNSVDSVVTDPPYEIGFMGKGWDDSGIANNPELWKEVLRVLKPGGHLLSFSHSRTYHRQAVAVEDSGFEIRDQIMWIYGSGFPKSHNISKQLDKRGGNNHLVSEVAQKLKEARESRGISKTEADKLFCDGTTNYMWFEGRKDGVRLPDDISFEKICNEWNELKSYQDKIRSANREIVGNYDGDMGGLGGERLGNSGGEITISATDVAKDWEGWGTALKPAHEPIVMARKPFKGSVAQNVLEWGTGGINVDGCRIGSESRTVPIHSDDVKEDNTLFGLHPTIQHHREETTLGRFPANIIFDEEAGKILDEQSGITSQGHWPKGKTKGFGEFGGGESIYEGVGPKDKEKGGASRFFYCPKTSKKDRDEGTTNAHPTVKPTDLMAYLIRLITPKGGLVLDPFMGSGSTGKAAIREGMSFIGIEREDEYMEIAKSRIEYEQKKNKHTQFFNI